MVLASIRQCLDCQVSSTLCAMYRQHTPVDCGKIGEVHT